jgi:hypothetical protein
MNGLTFGAAGIRSGAQRTADVSGRPVVAAADDEGNSGTAPGDLVVDTVNHTLKDLMPTSISAGSLKLARQSLDWLLPSSAGAIVDLAHNGDPVAFDPSSLGTSLLGFTIDGTVSPSLQPGGVAALSFNVPLPAPISGVIGGAPTDDITLHSSNSVPGGLDVEKGAFTLGIPGGVSVGIATLDPFSITYDSDPDVFDGNIGLALPVIDSKINAHIQFQHGRFVEGDARASFGDAFMLYPDVFLAGANFHLASPLTPTCTDPASLGGGITVAVGPVDTNGDGLFNVNGDANYTFPVDTPPGVSPACTAPGVFNITGSGALFPAVGGGIPVGSAFVKYRTDGDLSLGANLVLGDDALGVSGEVYGELNASVHPVGFLLYGSVSAQLFGATLDHSAVAISNLGFGACVSSLGVTIGTIRYDFNGGLSFTFLGCSLGPLIPSGITPPPGLQVAWKASVAKSASAAVSIPVPAHVPQEGILLHTAALFGTPIVKLTGPGGQVITTPAPDPTAMTDSVTSLAGSFAIPQEHATWIVLKHPQAGNWQLTNLPGSAPISSIDLAKGLPAVSVNATVTPAPRRHFELAYRNATAPGRKVQFIETYSHHVIHALGSTTGHRGHISFLPGPGPRGTRTIKAIVTERGDVAATITVAHYLAPGPRKLITPGPLTLTRTRSKLRIHWKAVPGADKFVVRVFLSDGRGLLMTEKPRVHSVTVPDVSGYEHGHVIVVGVTASGRPGPTGTATLEARKPTCLKPRAVRGKLKCDPARQRLGSGCRIWPSGRRSRSRVESSQSARGCRKMVR